MIHEGLVTISSQNVVGQVEKKARQSDDLVTAQSSEQPTQTTEASSSSSDNASQTGEEVSNVSASSLSGVSAARENEKKQLNPKKRNAADQSNTLFYNPAQVFNRDMSLLAIKVFGQGRVENAIEKYNKAPVKRHVNEEIKGLSIVEPLAATGLRSLRYAKELPKSIFRRIVTSDIDPDAVENAKKHRSLNDVEESCMTCVCADASQLLVAGSYICGQDSWDVVDLDPYGTATPFIDGAVRAVKDGGMLCVTYTDMQILGGNSPDVAFYKYGGNTSKARYLHELALRLALHQIQVSAARYRRAITPLLSLSVDFYVRLFIRVDNAPIRCKQMASQTAVAVQCTSCDYFLALPFGRSVIKAGKAQERRRGDKRERKTSSDKTESQIQSQGEADPLIKQDKLLTTVTLFGPVEEENQKFGVPRLPEFCAGGKCPECDAATTLAGPFYAGPLHDMKFVESMLEEIQKSKDTVAVENLHEHDLFSKETCAKIERGLLKSDDSSSCIEQLSSHLDWVDTCIRRFETEMKDFKFVAMSENVRPKIIGVLTAVKDELLDVPLFYSLTSLCNEAHIGMMKTDKMRSALLNMGYRVGLFHRDPQSIKTDAPPSVVFDIVRAWITVTANSHSSSRHHNTDCIHRPLAEREK